MKLLLLIIHPSSRDAATSKMALFLIIANDWKPLTITTKCSNLDVPAVLDPPLYVLYSTNSHCRFVKFELKLDVKYCKPLRNANAPFPNMLPICQ